MLHLLHPAALWTLAASALPLTIHLWRRPPRTVRLGSLRFLENVPRRPSRNLRWREIFLLCTRLGLLAVLSLLLAGPSWIVSPITGARRWALIDPTAAPDGESLAHWNDALRAGYEPHRLSAGFPSAAGDFPRVAAPDDVAVPDLWSLLREADAELPAGSTLAVFSPQRIDALRGIRPALGHCKVEWFRTPDVGGTGPHVWVASASGQRVLTGRSDAQATAYTAKSTNDPTGDYRVPPATSVLILHDAEHAIDARYVDAAAQTVADSAGRRVNIQDREITPDVENVAATDWTFWLSTLPVPAELAKRAPRIVQYAAGNPATGASWIVAPSDNAAEGARLWKRVNAPPPDPAGTILWRDGQGDPVLTYSQLDAGERWYLGTRFDSGWTDLTRTTALPAWMRTLLFPETVVPSDAERSHDRRLADPAQSLPSEAPAAVVPLLASTNQPSKDLHWPLWTFAALLFAVERVLSLRRRGLLLSAPQIHPEFVVSR